MGPAPICNPEPSEPGAPVWSERAHLFVGVLAFSPSWMPFATMGNVMFELAAIFGSAWNTCQKFFSFVTWRELSLGLTADQLSILVLRT